MSMDLATFSSNVNKRASRDFGPLVCSPIVNPIRGKQYVDMYIKVFYFPKDDMMKWIDENRQRYHLAHLLTLVSFSSHNQLPTADLNLLLRRRDEVRKICS